MPVSMEWVWWSGYLLAGIVGWLLVMRALTKRGWEWDFFEYGVLGILMPELWIVVILCVVFWPLLIPYVWVRTKDADPPPNLLAQTTPQRSVELDQKRDVRGELHGKIARAVTDLIPGGVISHGKERYDAVLLHGSAQVGEEVRIVGSDDLRLQVERSQAGTE